jgi:ABC-type sulfate transport system permease subunit
LLQELRVVETGVQIFFAFLLTLPFQARFPSITGFQESAYLVTLIAAGGAAVVLVAPVAVHRVLFRQRRKDVLVRFASRCAAVGLALVLVSMLAAVLLVLDVVIGAAAAWVITGFLAAGAIGLWYVLPLRWRREAAR